MAVHELVFSKVLASEAMLLLKIFWVFLSRIQNSFIVA